MTDKKIDPKVLAAAKEVAKKCNVAILYRNPKGEFFTSKNAADNTCKPEEVQTFDFTKVKAGKDESLVKITNKELQKYPELAANGWKEGDEVEELDWAIENKKPEPQA